MSFEKILEFFAWKVLWNPFLPIFFLSLGIYLTLGMRFFQFRRFPDIVRNTLGTLLHRKKSASEAEGKNVFVSSYQAFATALGGTVGTGNIAGVSSAIALGGPGALFWMWLAAFLGMATKCGEIVLAQCYKQRYEDGTSYGSAAFYIQKGLVEERGWKWCKALAIIFTLAMLGSFFFAPGPFTIIEASQKAFKFSSNTAILLTVLYTGLIYTIVLGGIPRIVRFAEFIVPPMVLLYLAAGLFVLLHNIPGTLQAFRDVFTYAFTPHAAVGGFAGVTIIKALQVGVARSVYSNEAGWGSSPIIHAAATVDHPGRQGMWGAMEVFMDTIVVCSITGLMVLSTGMWKTGYGGAGAVGDAFSSVFGPAGGVLLAVFMVLFALTTTTGWFSYLESLMVYIAADKTREQRRKFIQIVRLAGPFFPMCVSIYAFHHKMVPSVVWMMLDIQSAIPVYVNLVALVLLSPLIFRKIREFETDYLDPERVARQMRKQGTPQGEKA